MNIELAVEAVIFSALAIWFFIRETRTSAIILLIWQIVFLVANIASFYFIANDANMSVAKILIPFLIFRLVGIMMLSFDISWKLPIRTYT